jgi:hypothetical protein
VNVERLCFADQMVILSDPDADAHFSGAIPVGDGPFSVTAELDYRDDVDIWSVTLAQGQTVTASVSTIYEYPEPQLALFGPGGALLDLQDIFDGGEITYTAAEAGTY